MLNKRKSGVLLHVTSLPSSFGIGDLGQEARSFIDFLADSCQHVWQILPLNPTRIQYGNSPYSSTSAFAGNPLLISPKLLVGDGLLRAEDLDPIPDFTDGRVDFEAAISYKKKAVSTGI